MKASDIGLLNEELKGNTALTELNLESEDEKRERDGERRKRMTGNEIGDEGAKTMSEMLKVNTALTSLNLRGEEERKERKEKRKNKKE